MKIKIGILACLTLLFGGVNAQTFEEYFTDNTLRVDYIFAGDATQQSIYLSSLSTTPQWAGRRVNLSQLPLMGNGDIVMKDAKSGRVIYRSSFSSLFQEWLSTPQAQTTARSFENTFLLPMPKDSAVVSVTLRNLHHESVAEMHHTVRPDDILIKTIGEKDITAHRYLHRSGDPSQCIDVAIVAEGYTEAEMETFYADARATVDALFSHEPFASYKNSFNFVAVASPSQDSGVSVPRDDKWIRTAVSSHFDTFYSDRYLTTSAVYDLHDALSGIAYEHIIILANTDVYGGGGIYNSYTLTTAHHAMFRPVVVHEFGHSFGGLADEYFYEDDLFSGYYPLEVEPWEQNITTMVDFSSKWQDMLPSGLAVPTPQNEKDHPVAVYEGGGYSFKGVYRPAYDCRMKTNTAPAFCAVCRRAIERMILFYTTARAEK